MPRLTNATTGVTVEVSEETAENLDGNVWEPAKDDEKPTTRRKSN